MRKTTLFLILILCTSFPLFAQYQGSIKTEEGIIQGEFPSDIVLCNIRFKAKGKTKYKTYAPEELSTFSIEHTRYESIEIMTPDLKTVKGNNLHLQVIRKNKNL